MNVGIVFNLVITLFGQSSELSHPHQIKEWHSAWLNNRHLPSQVTVNVRQLA